MCGIIGLFLKNRALEPTLGGLLADMLATMSDRGPDSAGFSIYGASARGRIKLTLRGRDRIALANCVQALEADFGGDAQPTLRDNHAVVSLAAALEGNTRAWLAANWAGIDIVGAGESMEIYKEVGRPETVTRRFGLAAMSGSHGIGHTRMATESAVTTDGAHPFSAGLDQCLVHNGSLSNHRGVRRVLEREGLSFTTDNDSEVAAGYLTWRMREGSSLKDALEEGLADLDGFYTFVVATKSGFAVLRDPISCKPAMMAETDDYVAFGTEYRALVGLPGIKNARVFEPEPAVVYAWERN